MPRHHLKRCFAALAAACALAAAVPTGGVAAATTAGKLQVDSRNLLVAPGHSGTGNVRVQFSAGHIARKGIMLHVDLDLSEVNAIGTVTAGSRGWGCGRHGLKLRCIAQFDQGGRAPTLLFQVAARSDAPLDSRVALPIVATSVGVSATRTVTVGVTGATDLQTAPTTALSADPGDWVELTSTVRNAGPDPVRGVVLTLHTDWLVKYGGEFRNCRFQEGTPLICHFDTELEPGVTYRFSEPLPFSTYRIARTGLVVTNRLQWWTADDWALVEKEPSEPLPPTTPGTGGELRLVPQNAAARTDTDTSNNWTDVRLTFTGNQPADTAAVGDQARARVGDQVKVTVGLRNLGPGVVETWREMPLVRLAIPEGTTAVAVPWGCRPDIDGNWPGGEDGQPGARAYMCSGPGDGAWPEQTIPYEFTLHVDRLTRRVTGAVTVDVDADTDPRNDRAEIVILPAADGGGAGDPDGDGSLPITGSAVSSTVALGGLLLAVGLGGYLLVRRRRTRFVA
ncbi:LPXTG cell wall anchor domain-containing protein [Micromonospora sp. WMMD714]|uniref:LPXTG cell wall anchor domain-containing protein n=1 Tax=Micromonospora sp. WMMD714 TaxID=3016097 RepID=UPI00249A7063|nr:LPXTG cell wall anchor domain-containing protein [Micromonospora sp. WMMD714]WFE63273.1 LPXTG cell wall anchor domain-containing protein [Micromonospora sp. WMMD714]